MNGSWAKVLFLLQCFQVAFLALHDWVPLGSLNDIRAVQRENSRGKLMLTTLLSTAPFVLLLLGSAQHLHGRYPNTLLGWLAIAYGALFLGEIRAWWLPYLNGADTVTTARYRGMFGATHAFLPERRGFTVNTLHVILHCSTVATLILVATHAFAHRGS